MLWNCAALCLSPCAETKPLISHGLGPCVREKSPQLQSFRQAFFKRPRISAYSKRPRVLLTHAEAREDTIYYVLGHGSAVHRAERGQGELEIGACDILGHSDSERGERFVDVMHSSADIRILTGV